MVLTLIHNVFKSFGVVLVAVIFIQVHNSSSQRSRCTKHRASLKKQNEISLSGMLSFYMYCGRRQLWPSMRPVCPSLSDTMQCTVTASDSDPTLDQSFLLEGMFGSGVQDRKHSPNCSSRAQAVGHHFPLFWCVTLSRNSFHVALYSFIHRPR